MVYDHSMVITRLYRGFLTVAFNAQMKEKSVSFDKQACRKSPLVGLKPSFPVLFLPLKDNKDQWVYKTTK